MIILYDREINRIGYITDYIAKVSYNKHLRQLWEASVVVAASEALDLQIKPYYFMEIFDDAGEYVGMFRVAPKDIKVSDEESTITYKLYHALHTLYDTAVIEELEVTSSDAGLLFKQLLAMQTKQYWVFKGSEDYPDINDFKIEKQNGLVAPFFKIIEEMGDDYYPIFNTTSFPWSVTVGRVGAVKTRVKEGYTMSDFGISKDPTVMFNRIYPIGERDTYTNDITKEEVDDDELKRRQEAWDQYEADYEAYTIRRDEMTEVRNAEIERRNKLTEERNEKIKKLKDSGSKEEVPPLEFGDLPPSASILIEPTKPDDTGLTQTKGAVYIRDVNNGLDYIQNDELVEEYGPIEYYQSFNTDDPQELLELGTKLLQEMQLESTSITATIKDIKLLVENPLVIDRVRLGDKVYFETEEFGQMEMYITDESKDDIYGSPENIQLTLALDLSKTSKTGSGSNASVVKDLITSIKDTDRQLDLVRTSVDGKNTLTTSDIPPENPRIGDTWFFKTIDETTGLPIARMRSWNGAQWVDLLDSIDSSMKIVDDRQNELEYLMGELAAEKSRIDLENSWIKEDTNAFRSVVGEGSTGLLSIINQQADRIIFDVHGIEDGGSMLMITKNGTIMDEAFIQTGHIADASVTNAKISDLNADKITSGTIDASQVTVSNIDANEITSGVIDANQIDVINMDADNINSGSIDASKIRVINLDADDITSGTLSGGNVFWNLDEGTFLIGDGLENYEFWYDGNTLRLGNVDVDISHNEIVTNIKDELKSVQENIQDSLTKEAILTDEELVERLKGKDGEDGQTPEIIDGMWAFGGESTGVKAVGEDGSTEILKAWASDISADNTTVSNFTLDESIGVTYKWVGLFTPRWRTSTQEMDTLRNDPKNYIWTRQNPKSVDLDIKSIQDITNDLKLDNDSYKGQIEEINATVGGLSDGQQDAIRQIQETLASIEQLQLAENATAEEIQATKTLIDYVNNQLSSVEEGLTEGNVNIQSLSQMLDNYVENLPQEIQSKLDSDEYIIKLKKSVIIDDNGISLSQEGSRYGINIDNEAMRFFNRGNTVAYINSSRLYIDEAEILSSIKIFNLIARKHVTENGEKIVYFNWLDN